MSDQHLIEAAKAGDFQKVQALMRGVIDLEQKDDYGWTALNWAAGKGDRSIVKLLLEAGAYVGNRGRDHRTPYQIALAAAQLETAELLQQAELQAGEVSAPAVLQYCKAYPLNELAGFPGWTTQQDLAENSVLYVHQDFSVTRSMWHGEDVVFTPVSDAWRNYCVEALDFNVPTDLQLAAEYRSGFHSN